MPVVLVSMPPIVADPAMVGRAVLAGGVPTTMVTVAGLLLRPRESVVVYVNVSMPTKPGFGV